MSPSVSVSIAPTHCEVLACIRDTKLYRFDPIRKTDAASIRALMARGFVRMLPGEFYELTQLGIHAAELVKAEYIRLNGNRP